MEQLNDDVLIQVLQFLDSRALRSFLTVYKRCRSLLPLCIAKLTYAKREYDLLQYRYLETLIVGWEEIVHPQQLSNLPCLRSLCFRFTTVDLSVLSSLPNLTRFDVLAPSIPLLDSSKHPKKKILTNDSQLDLNFLRNLVKLRCAECELKELHIKHLSNLTVLNCEFNDLESLDVSILINLVKLNCSYNKIKSLNLSNLVNLTKLNCSDNALLTLELTQSPNLEILDCGINQIQSLGISGLMKLKMVICCENPILNIDFDSLPSNLKIDYRLTPLAERETSNGGLRNFSYSDSDYSDSDSDSDSDFSLI